MVVIDYVLWTSQPLKLDHIPGYVQCLQSQGGLVQLLCRVTERCVRRCSCSCLTSPVHRLPIIQCQIIFQGLSQFPTWIHTSLLWGLWNDPLLGYSSFYSCFELHRIRRLHVYRTNKLRGLFGRRKNRPMLWFL